MKRIDWDRLVPLGVNGKTVRDRMGLGLGAAALFSLSYVGNFAGAVNDLYRYRGGKRTLIEGAKMLPFRDLIDHVFWAFGVMAVAMGFVAIGFYKYHSQGSRSIYTMKRLPNRWELWRRVWTVPLVGAVACGISVLALTGLYYVCYLLGTPAGCLP